MDAYMNRLIQERREREASLAGLLQRFVTETGKGEEFLNWLAKDMGLDKPMDLTNVDALIEQYARTGQ